jgi:two-component system chemotaxis response regulator CheY
VSEHAAIGRAIVVEDSGPTRRIIASILRELRFAVIEATDGREALDRLEGADAPDVAIVDWNMPVLDGMAFVREVRATPRLAEMRVLMVTTRTELAQVARALEEGADEYLMKPFTREMLVEKLALLGLGSP